MFKQSNRVVKITVIVLLISFLLPSISVFAQDAQKTYTPEEYYYMGLDAGDNDYSGGGAVAGGFASGFLLGLIGWGLGYLIVANQDTDVPRRYLSGLDITAKMNFEDSYKEYVEKV